MGKTRSDVLQSKYSNRVGGAPEPLTDYMDVSRVFWFVFINVPLILTLGSQFPYAILPHAIRRMLTKQCRVVIIAILDGNKMLVLGEC